MGTQAKNIATFYHFATDTYFNNEQCFASHMTVHRATSLKAKKNEVEIPNFAPTFVSACNLDHVLFRWHAWSMCRTMWINIILLSSQIFHMCSLVYSEFLSLGSFSVLYFSTIRIESLIIFRSSLIETSLYLVIQLNSSAKSATFFLFEWIPSHMYAHVLFQ